MEISSSLSLDPRTLLISLSMLSFLLAAFSLSFENAKTNEHFGFTEYGNAMLAAGVSFLLFFLRGHIPWSMTYLLANALILAGVSYALLAHTRLFGAKTPSLLIAVVSAFGLSGVVAVNFFDVPRQYAAFSMSSAVALQLGLTSIMIFRRTNRLDTPASWISGAVLALLASAFGLRVVMSLVDHSSFAVPAAKSLPQASTLIIAALFLVATFIGFYAMADERRRRETLANLRRDESSGLFTQTAFFEMAKEIDPLKKPEIYALVMVEVDSLQATKEAFGHVSGGAVVAQAGRLIASAVRTSDIAGRYGCDAFCILLRGFDESETAQFTERLAMAGERQVVKLRDGREIRFTLSCGYACKTDVSHVHRGPETVYDLLERADQALCLAKRGGPNQTRAAMPPRFVST